MANVLLLGLLACATPGWAEPVASSPSGARLPTGDSDAFRHVDSAVGVPAIPGPSGAPRVAAITLAARRISSGFGMRTDPFTGSWRFHRGVDIPAAFGTPVHAAAAGRVSIASRVNGYGNLVELDHGHGMDTRYGHLATIAVLPGAEVDQGQVIGYVGSTGRSTGAHLHFELRSFGQAVDPYRPLYVAGPAGFPAYLALPEVAARERWNANDARLPSLQF